MQSFKQFLYESKIHVPQFTTTEEAEDFIAALGVDDTVDGLVVDPFTGEVLMRPGDTRRAKLKDSAKTKLDKSESTPMFLPFTKDEDHWKDESDFLRFYNVVFNDLEDEVDDPQKMMDAGYDVSYSYPAAIKRKDGKEFDEDDVMNIESFMEFSQHNAPHGIKLNYKAKESEKILRVSVLFA